MSGDERCDALHQALDRWVEILRIAPSLRGHAEGTLAYFDVRLFGQLTLNGCHLRRSDGGKLYFVPPGSDPSRKGKPRVHVHGPRLRAEITRKAGAAYEALQS